MNPQSAKKRRDERLFDSLEQSRVTRQHAAAKQRIRKKPVPDDTNAQRPPEKLPDPWLFDSESLLRELDRCRVVAHVRKDLNLSFAMTPYDRVMPLITGEVKLTPIGEPFIAAELATKVA